MVRKNRCFTGCHTLVTMSRGFKVMDNESLSNRINQKGREVAWFATTRPSVRSRLAPPSFQSKASLHGRRQNGHHRCRGRCTIALVFTLAMFLDSGLMWFSLVPCLRDAVCLFDELTTLHQLVNNPLLCGFNLSKSRVRSGIWRSY
jgi:hypothetical protein